MVVVGRPVKYSEDPYLSDSFGPIFVLDIEVRFWLKGKSLSGSAEKDVIQLAVRRDSSGQANMRLGNEYLVFVEQTEAGPVVLNGNQGAMLIVGGRVSISGREIDVSDLRTDEMFEIRGAAHDIKSCGRD
jgi:hypothetical protein